MSTSTKSEREKLKKEFEERVLELAVHIEDHKKKMKKLVQNLTEDINTESEKLHKDFDKKTKKMLREFKKKVAEKRIRMEAERNKTA